MSIQLCQIVVSVRPLTGLYVETALHRRIYICNGDCFLTSSVCQRHMLCMLFTYHKRNFHAWRDLTKFRRKMFDILITLSAVAVRVLYPPC